MHDTFFERSDRLKTCNGHEAIIYVVYAQHAINKLVKFHESVR